MATPAELQIRYEKKANKELKHTLKLQQQKLMKTRAEKVSAERKLKEVQDDLLNDGPLLSMVVQQNMYHNVEIKHHQCQWQFVHRN